MKKGFSLETFCQECNIFMGKCKGKRLFKSGGKGQTKVCQNRVQAPINDPNPLQVIACQSLFWTKIKHGMGRTQAFADAIVQTSDDAFEIARIKRPHLIEEYKAGKKIYKKC